jgi:hypothetical protein
VGTNTWFKGTNMKEQEQTYGLREQHYRVGTKSMGVKEPMV